MTNDTITIIKKFEPLFELLDGKHPEVDIVLLTGGRYSSKSFTVAVLSLIAMAQYLYKVLYSRFTNTSISDSVKSEVEKKVPLLGIDSKINIKQNRIELIGDDNIAIAFKGIKTGSKLQTASLKSLEGFNLWIVDEADETPDFETFEKVYLSIRSLEKRNITILILNPSSRLHWIYQKWWKGKGVEDGFSGIKDNIMYIHSSYLDLPADKIPTNIKNYYNELKEFDYERYTNIVKGGWVKQQSGALFPMEKLNYYSELPTSIPSAKFAFIDVADQGKDFHAVCFGSLINDKLYITDTLFTNLPTSANVQHTAEKINTNKPDIVRVETNFGGSMYMQLLQPLIKDDNVQLLPVKATTNKHSRIITNEFFVLKHVYFKEESKWDGDYRAFMNNTFEYMKDGSAVHDDAPDSLEGLCQLFKTYYFDIFQ